MRKIEEVCGDPVVAMVGQQKEPFHSLSKL